MSKITQYAAITSPQSDDLLIVVDVHDQSMAPSGTDKKMTLAQLAATQPYQFAPENYGAKGDGQQALVTVVASSGVINTTPIGAPAAPTVSNSGSGGTIAAGVYKVEVTYVNAYGETVASGSTTTTTSGSTSTITINSPSPAQNATGWYAYVTQAGGNTYTRQQGAGSPTAIEVPLILTAPPSSGGANPPGADTTAAQVFTSTAVDGGKNIMICGALGTPGGPLIDTIASVQSSTQATLATLTATTSQAGCAMVFSSDDRAAIDNCIQAARAYALANDNFCQVILGPKIYGLGTGLFQSTAPNGTSQPAGWAYNTQIRIPAPAQSGQTPKLEFQLLGPGDGAGTYFWVSMLPCLHGATFISYTVGPVGGDPTYGNQSIIGGPLGGTNFNGSNAFANVRAVIKGVQVVQPGWSNSIGIDLTFCAGCVVRASSQAYAPTNATGGGINPSSGWVSSATWQNKTGVGMVTPNAQNNDDCVIESFCTEGITTGITTEADHITINRLVIVNAYFGIKCVPGPGNVSHDLTIAQWSYENVSGAAFANPGGGPGVIAVNIVMDGENVSGGIIYDVRDLGNCFYGIIYWSDIFRSPAVPVVSGAANLKVINTMASPGHMSAPPSVPATTVTAALINRDATVVVHTGAGVTVSAITVDGTATSQTVAAASSSVPIRVPSGKTIALTYAGGTPTWDWWLD